MFKYEVNRLIAFSMLPIAVYSVQRFSPNPIGSTAVWWMVQFLILALFIVSLFYNSKVRNKPITYFVGIYLLWVVISIIRGTFSAEYYWDWKGLIMNSFSLLIPLSVFTFSNKRILQSALSFYVKYTIPLAIVILPFLPPGVWGWYLFPVSFLMLFFPLVKNHWKVVLLIVSLTAAFANISVRSHVLKYTVPILLLILYYTRVFIASGRIIKIASHVFLIVPWIFFFLAVSGTFNVLKIDEYVSGVEKSSAGYDQPLNQDSRTGLYEEVLRSAQKHHYWWMGRTPARGNDTEYFAHMITEGRQERLRNEAAILNTFTWTGVIGVVLYFLVFYSASFLSIYRSNNIFSKLIGLFVAFRWFYAWVEDYQEFDINNFVIWMMIAACFSVQFRKMNNLEVKLWARGIFESRYKKLELFYDLNNSR